MLVIMILTLGYYIFDGYNFKLVSIHFGRLEQLPFIILKCHIDISILTLLLFALILRIK